MLEKTTFSGGAGGNQTSRSVGSNLTAGSRRARRSRRHPARSRRRLGSASTSARAQAVRRACAAGPRSARSAGLQAVQAGGDRRSMMAQAITVSPEPAGTNDERLPLAGPDGGTRPLDGPSLISRSAHFTALAPRRAGRAPRRASRREPRRPRRARARRRDLRAQPAVWPRRGRRGGARARGRRSRS